MLAVIAEMPEKKIFDSGAAEILLLIFGVCKLPGVLPLKMPAKVARAVSSGVRLILHITVAANKQEESAIAVLGCKEVALICGSGAREVNGTPLRCAVHYTYT